MKNFKTCSCCGRVYSEKKWSKLEYVGEMEMEDGEEPSRIELRNCKCRTTLAVGYTKNGERYE